LPKGATKKPESTTTGIEYPNNVLSGKKLEAEYWPREGLQTWVDKNEIYGSKSIPP
jgi:hypothetical protein